MAIGEICHSFFDALMLVCRHITATSLSLVGIRKGAHQIKSTNQ